MTTNTTIIVIVVNPTDKKLENVMLIFEMLVLSHYILLVIVDADPSGNTCHKALFSIGGSTSTSRQWDIKVTQYECGDYDSSGYEFFIY